MLPFGLVRLFDSLLVEIVVNLVEEFWANDAVVGASICFEGIGSCIRGTVVEIIHSFWVEYLVDADRVSTDDDLREAVILQWRIIAGSQSSVSNDQ